jgi:lactose/L-arabinose transport system ATP-binding protein
MSGLELIEVSKSYGPVDIIHSVDLAVKDGEFVVFVGPSGCGKSTLLRMIAGLEDVTAGELRIGGKDMTDVAPSKRGVAMVFQSYALYPHMSVEQNMAFGLSIKGTPKAEIKEKVAKAAKILNLDQLLQRRPKQLSGGQRQRVAIGRAIVREPDVFLFDEPLSNLDAELRVRMRLEIAKLHTDLGATMIYVTHDQVEAMTLADKIVVLNRGNIEQVGAPLELYDDPDNLFVAGFIGSPKMNFLKSKVVASDAKGLTLEVADFGNAITHLPNISKAVAPGTELTLGVRPEYFNLAAKDRFELNVQAVEHLGSTIFAYVRSSLDNLITVEVEDDRTLGAGSKLLIGIEPSRALLFDPATGHRIR